MKQINLYSGDNDHAGHYKTSIVHVNDKEYILMSKDNDDRSAEFVGDVIANNKRLNAKISKQQETTKQNILKAHKYKCNNDRLIQLKGSFMQRLEFLFRAL